MAKMGSHCLVSVWTQEETESEEEWRGTQSLEDHEKVRLPLALKILLSLQGPVSTLSSWQAAHPWCTAQHGRGLGPGWEMA